MGLQCQGRAASRGEKLSRRGVGSRRGPSRVLRCRGTDRQQAGLFLGGCVKRIALYTAITGQYEARSEVVFPFAAVSTSAKLDLFRFTDVPDSEVIPGKGPSGLRWREVQEEPRLPGDPIRSARAIKILGHPILASYDITVWVDNRIRLKVGPDELVERFLPNGADLAVPLHCHRESLADEFDAVLELRLDDPRRVREQRSAYRRYKPSLLPQPVPWTAILIRRNTPEVQRFNALWWEQVLRYSRRDQLSFSYAREMVPELNISQFEVNNFESEIHQWRRSSDVKRQPDAGRWAPADVKAEVADAARFLGAALSRRYWSGR